MATGQPLTLEYTNPAPCLRCGAEIHTPERLGRPRRLCDRCRQAARAATFLRQAQLALKAIENPVRLPGVLAAQEHVRAALEELDR
jgi:hypothetical protein